MSPKKDLHLSISTIHKEALEQFLEKKELDKWKKGVKLAEKNKEYLQLCKTLGNESGEVHEY